MKLDSDMKLDSGDECRYVYMRLGSGHAVGQCVYMQGWEVVFCTRLGSGFIIEAGEQILMTPGGRYGAGQWIYKCMRLGSGFI